jgi:solute carrier family 25 (mitochondrial adenine nucleotide translocator), member 4/5/6/31
MSVDTAMKFLTDFVVGGASASVAKTINSPLEVAKLRLQTQPGMYNGIVDCLVRIPREEGIFAYWKGNATNVLRYFPTQALNFAINDGVNRMFFPLGKRNYSYNDQLWRGLVAGGAAGGTSLAFVYSLDLVRTRLSVDIGKKGEKNYNGFIHCYSQTFKEGGFKALYKGFGISVIGIIPYRAVYFGGYDVLKAIFLKPDSSFFLKWFISQTNTIMAQFLTYPIDTIRRVQMLGGTKKKDGTIYPQYRSAWHCLISIVKERGVPALFKGALANTYRATGAALCMVFYDEFQTKLKNSQAQSK